MFFKTKPPVGPTTITAPVKPPLANGFMSNPVPGKEAEPAATKSLGGISLLSTPAAPSTPIVAAAPVAASPDQLKKWAANEASLAVTFMRIVSVMMRSEQYKHHTLADLEWLVFPAILANQCAVLQSAATDKQPPIPTAVALWANVSTDVDHRLSQELSSRVRLKPQEWQSGENLWLIDIVGPLEASKLLVNELRVRTFCGRQAKYRVVAADGKIAILSL